MFSRCVICVSLLLCVFSLRDHAVDGAMTMDQMKQAAKGLRKVCQPKIGVDIALVDGLQSGNFPEDEKLQCYIKCIMGLTKTMKNGVPDLPILLKQINIMMPADIQERSSDIARKCSTLDFDSNACVAAWQFLKCQYENGPEVFFFP